ncbi:helix-turn-helix domain-containing protein [Bacillus sp. V59.32b]|uniref:helix-turn-helix domain-containing protein n=1 Tax=Bacillus sp. V59.32b TaxID=1758642 RepID=UPI000E3DA022|nr:XRE family transcriptional regulator [Bacillus sp. V59.32b]RFU68373.1 XRE family transcriptional regulator [Bacillus sp. V59.32b]
MEFGQRVKKVRKEKNLTLEELSKRSNVSKSMLSQIEREEKNPTIQIAAQIAAGLGVTISQMLGEHNKQEVIVIRKNQRPFQRNQVSGFERHLLSPSLSGNGIEFIFHVIPPLKESGPLPSQKQGVVEYIYVAQGKLKIELGNGQDVHVLDEGDSIFFEADTERRFVNLSDYDCHYYLIIDSHKV